MAPPSHTVFQFSHPGATVEVRHDQPPGDAPLLCTVGNVHVCVARPGPKPPKPNVPLLP